MNNYSVLDLLTLLGAVGLFLYGMKVMSEGLQKVAGDRMRTILSAMTRNRFSGVATGVLITALIQSSSASTVMVVSFVNAGLMSLQQSMAVIMGANVGTTFTAWIIAIFGVKVNVNALAVPLIAVAILLLFSKNSRYKSIGEFIIGFSFLFMGLGMISANVPELDANTLEFLANYSSNGFASVLLFVLVGMVITMVIQSSAATFAIVLVMSTKGWIGFDMACAAVLGSNIGTTITPVLASLSANQTAKKAALGHFLFNLFGTVWTTILFFTGLFVVVGGLQETGVIQLLADWLMSATHGSLALTLVIILWFSALISAFLDNIPFVATLIPLILAMGNSGMDIAPLWWAVSLGACLGGNGTLIGASANVVLSGISTRHGYPITFASYLKVGFPLMLVSILISTAYLLLRYT